MLRSFVAVLALAVASIAARAADEENPYKNTKVGDYAVYTLTTKSAGITADGTATQTITAKSDKEATVKITIVVKVGDKEVKVPDQEVKIDLTKPYDPTQTANLPAGTEAKAEKDKEGKEKIKVAGKEYDATWTTYKTNVKAMGLEIKGETKVWTAKDVPLGVLKTVMTSDFGGQKSEVTIELKESGNKK
jgi:hypothetical protein